MANQNHPWVQDFASFEAVLCCAHEVGHWDQAATLRAYQTYGFDDASTPGNDQTFKHVDTGVLLLHDGDVVGIQFGDGNLSEAFMDLFLVLNALGWKVAEVYHPAESLGALLNDMGKAIPGHMDFDVRAAKRVADTGHLPEATALIERGKSLLQGVAVGRQEAQDFNELALGELESMAPDHGLEVGEGGRSLPVALHEEAAPGSVGQTQDQVAFAQPPSAVVRPHHGQVFLDDDDAGPVVPVLGVATPQPPARPAQRDHAEDLLASQAPPADAPFADDAEPEHGDQVPAAMAESARVADAGPDHSILGASDLADRGEPCWTEATLAADVDTKMTSSGQPSTQSSAEVDTATEGLIRVGKSALTFDLPDEPVSLEAVGRFADEIRAAEVVHVWPGLVNQTERWDLIAEIDLSAPWFAEVLASELGAQSPLERIWFAAALLKLVRQHDRPQLRDLLGMILAGGSAEACGEPARSLVFAKADHQRIVDSVLNRFGALLLSQAGESFLDVRTAEQPVLDEHVELRAFNVRSLLEAPTPILYVVHLDVLDGPFVEMIVNLLLAVAFRYSTSTRARKQSEALQHEVERRESTQREAERMEALETVQKTMAGLMEHLKKAGLPLPT